MTIWGFTVFCSLFSVPTLGAREYSPACIHENMRQTPYPQEYHRPYLNPAPLLVPQQMKQADFLTCPLVYVQPSSDIEQRNLVLAFSFGK